MNGATPPASTAALVTAEEHRKESGTADVGNESKTASTKAQAELPRCDKTAEVAILAATTTAAVAATHAVLADNRSPSSVHLALLSDSSQSFSSATSSMVTDLSPSVKAKLLHKLVPNQPLSPVGATSEESSAAFSNNSNEETPRLPCCPRYLQEEKRRVQEKHLENVSAWMEAKRALECSEALTSGSRDATPSASFTKRRVSNSMVPEV